MMCYSDEYIQLISDVKTKINVTLKEKQQQNRYDTVYAEALAFVVLFTLIVNQITKPMLNEIDPAEALKSVE